MAKKARKAKGSKARAAQGKSSNRALRELIEQVIASQHRGDAGERKAALGKLVGFKTSSTELRRHAAEAQAAVHNPMDVDRVRLLGEIAARL